MIALHALASLFAIQLALAPSTATKSAAPLETSSVLLPSPTPASASERWPGSDALIERLAKEAETTAKAKSPLALGHLYRLWNMNKLLERPKRVRAALETILALPKNDPLLEAHAKEQLSELLTQEGKLADAARLEKSVGFVTEAMLIGPFENSAGEGQEEAYPPETAIHLDEAIEGKGHPVRWRELKGVADRGVFELGALVSPSSESTAYLLVAVESTKAQNAALRVGSSDQLKVFLDGAPVYALDSRRPASIDQDAIPVVLHAGPNLLLVKSSWVQNPGRVMFRLTKPDGAPLDGVTVHGDRATIERAANALEKSGPRKRAPAAKHKVIAVTTALDAAIAKRKGKDLADALALRADLAAVLALFDRRKLPTPPEEDLEAAIRLDPSNPTMRFFYAHRAQERDPTIAREELEAALVSDPGHVPSLYKLADMAKSSGRTIEANERLDEAIAKDPSFTPAHVARAALRFDQALDRDLALLELARTEEKLTSGSIAAEVARMRRSLDDRAGSKKDAMRALALDYTDAGARSLLIGIALDAGDTKTALAELDAQIALYPWQLHARLRKARLLAASPSPETRAQARAILDEAERIFPDATEIPNLEAELSLFDGDEKTALAKLEKSLDLDPNQPEVRRHRGALSGAKQELEDEYTRGTKDLLATPVSADETSWGAAFLTDRTALRLYENGQSTRFQQMAIRLANPKLKDGVRIQRIAYSPSREIVEVLSAERIRPTGEVIKATSISDDGERGKVAGMYVDRRFKTIAFDDVEQGDIVHIRYRTDSVGSNMFGSFFGDMGDLQGALPKVDVLYTAIAPKSRPLYYGLIHAKEPIKSDDGNVVKLTWSYDHLDALSPETFSPPYPEIGSMVSVSTYKSWSDLGRWYARLFSEQLELDDAARAAAKKAIAGAKDDGEKIRRLYDYVVKNTRYVGIELGIHGWKPFKASEVHRRRYGDCKDKATLLAALLRDNGIDATITLVRTSDRGVLPADHATMWAFNHAITYVPSQDLFLDGTAEFSGSRELPFPDQGAMALIVFPDGKTRLTTLPESKAEDNMNTSEYAAALSKDGQLALSGAERFYGARASALRQEMEEPEQRKTRLEKQLNQVFNGVHIGELEFSDMSNLEVPVEYKYSAAIERYGVEENGRYIIPLTLFQHQVATAYGQLATRKYDLYSNHPWSTRNVIRYQLPKGAKLEQLPEGASIDTPYMALTQTVREIPGGFETDDTVTMKSKRVPAAEYDAFRKACLAIDRALGRKVVLRW